MKIELTYLITLLGMVISVLLSVIAFFLKQLHSNFLKVETDLSAVKTAIQLIKAEVNAHYELLRQRISFLEKE
jgi:uncharacterized membrane-anchored protein YhcB (DUF1043 family)